MILNDNLEHFEIKIMEEKNVSTLFKYVGGKSWLKNNLRKSILSVIKTSLYCGRGFGAKKYFDLGHLAI